MLSVTHITVHEGVQYRKTGMGKLALHLPGLRADHAAAVIEFKVGG